ncbi:MAG: hypothetical protein EOM25_10340 [Deltaproteobacteria bacterium]|nr:hypothetical protein [Deltaproteobacteria bacterium]
MHGQFDLNVNPNDPDQTVKKSPLSDRALVHPFKTALAALIAALACEALELDQSLWAVISAIIVMQADLGGSVHAGGIRLLGTLVGAIVAVLMGLIVPDPTAAMVVAVFATLTICAIIPGLNEALRLAGITAAIVLMLGEPGESVVEIGAVRFLETALGITVALAVSLLVFPLRAATGLGRGLAEALNTCANLYRALIRAEFEDQDTSRDVVEARARLRTLRDDNKTLIRSGFKEPRSKKRVEFLRGIFRLEQRLEEHLTAMEHAVESPIPALSLLRPQLEALAETTLTALPVLARAVAHRSEPVDIPPLAPVLESVNERLQLIRHQGETLRFDLDDIIRFHALITEMRYVARTVLELAERLDHPGDDKKRLSNPSDEPGA